MNYPIGLLPLDESLINNGSSVGVTAGQVLCILPGCRGDGWYYVTARTSTDVAGTLFNNFQLFVDDRLVGVISSNVGELSVWVHADTGSRIQVRAIAADAVVVYHVDNLTATLYKRDGGC